MSGECGVWSGNYGLSAGRADCGPVVSFSFEIPTPARKTAQPVSRQSPGRAALLVGIADFNAFHGSSRRVDDGGR